MLNKRIPFLLILIGAASLAGCRAGFFGNEQAPQPSMPVAAPPSPIVVDGVRTSYADVVEKASPAVVRIEADQKARPQAPSRSPLDDFFRGLPGQGDQQPRLQRGLGSGVIVSADGSILTNAHVVDGADKITVQLADNKSFEAKLIGIDKASDLAVLKIEAQNMPYLTLGNSDSVRVGDIVLAIGNPLGIGQSVTAGIISAKGRRTGLSDGQSYEDFLQTDAPINRGNSGGALVNLNGELIGINSQILSGSPSGGNIGIGFSIPSNMAKSVMEQLLKDGRVRRGFLGITLQDINSDLARSFELSDTSGVLISGVQPNGPGDKAGLKAKDIITAINGEKVEDGNVLRNRIAGTTPDTEVKLSIIRDKQPQEISVTLGELNPETGTATGSTKGGDRNDGSAAGGSKLGLNLQPLTPQIAKELGVDRSGGLVVTGVDAEGPAAEAGVVRGDVILEINNQPVTSVDSVTSALSVSGDRPILLFISRRGQTVFLTVAP